MIFKESEIVEMLRTGLEPREIKSKLGVNGAQIVAVKHKHGFPMSQCRRPIKNPKIYEILSRGGSVKDIKNEFPDTRDSTITWARRKLGMPKLKPGRKFGIPNKTHKYTTSIEYIKTLKHSGMSYQEVAIAIGGSISRQRVMQIISNQPHKRRGFCEDCKQYRKLSRHHTNYLKDKVVYVCSKCHGKRHRGLKNKVLTPALACA
jgi:hypothetical protein